MKKKIALIMTVCMLAVVPTGCGNNATETKNEDKKVSSEQVNKTNGNSEDDLAIETKDTSEDKEVSTKLTIVVSDESDFTWYECEESDALIPKGGIVISGYVGTDMDVVIPKSINGKAVVAIDECAFSPYTKDEIEGTYEYFNFWTDTIGLEEDEVYGYVHDEQIAEYMDNHEPVSKITSIYIPSSIKLIGNYAFFFCDSLKDVTVYSEDEVDMDTSIGVGCECFAYCNLLEYANGNFADYRGYGDTDIYYGCEALREVKLSPSQKDEEGKLSWDNAMRGNFPNLEKVIIVHNEIIDQVEVPSKTDTYKKLMDRMKLNQSMLGNRAGTIKVRTIGKK